MPTMPVSMRPSLRLNSIFMKATAILALCTAAVVSVITFLEYQHATSLLAERMIENGSTITELTGHDVGGAIKFGKTEAAASVAQDLHEMTKGEMAEALFLRPDGSVFHHFIAPDMPSDLGHMESQAASLLARIAALAPNEGLSHEDELIVGEDGLTFAHPAYFGADAQIVGALVTRFDSTHVHNAVKDGLMRMLVTGGLVFAMALMACAFLFRSLLSKPLTQLTQSVSLVAKGDYAAAIPRTTAGDEVGDIARAIEVFRDDLATSVEATRIGMFKGSGFEGASAALIVTDTDFRIQFFNPAAQTLIAQHFPKIKGQDQIEGTSVLDLDTALRALPGLMQQGLPGRLGFSRGKEMLDLAFNTVTDSKGKHSGYVMEWRTTTQSRRNAAALAAMDATQLRGEFLSSGEVEEVNARLATALGLTSNDLAGQHLSLRGQLDFADQGQGSLWDKLANGKPLNALLRLGQKEGKALLIAAQINPLLDEAGQLRSYLLVGTDVTREQQVTAEAEAMRKKQQAEQSLVVSSLRQALSDLSDGALTTRITQTFPQDYETLRQDFNAAAERLSTAIADVSRNSVAIRGEVGDISSAAEQLSRRTEQQAATLEQTAAALDTMTSSVKTSAEVASNANARAVQAKASADSSGKVVREAVAAMGDIEESSSKISRITSVIDEIAFQTNLLALNAGVEAARAGEAGRGFAVVATEVRELAQRSSAAAREIATLISASSDQVKRGVSLVGEAGLSLHSIEQAVDEIHSLVEDIAKSAKEQSNGISELNTAVQHLDQVTQQNAAMFEETAAASQALNQMADALNKATEHFKTDTILAAPHRAEPRESTLTSWGTPKTAGQAPSFKAAPRSDRAPVASHGRTALALQGEAAGWEEF